MVVLPVALAVAMALAVASGGTLERLATVRLRGEVVLVSVLLLQFALPWLKLGGAAGRLAYAVWFATFPVMVLICLLNYRAPGMAIAGLGLALNAAVIGANGGMPVSAAVVASMSPGAFAIQEGDFVHVAMSAATRLPILADVLPVPGPAGMRGVASAGDVLLVCGACGVVAASMVGRHAPAHSRR